MKPENKSLTYTCHNSIGYAYADTVPGRIKRNRVLSICSPFSPSLPSSSSSALVFYESLKLESLFFN
ncbi:hypothetical protein Bca52824_024075 [Brassica carinata]|uniref:Uncharacterized protein n=1 Tax=Brassica carinata TaxID=52824 RepID=A0A8X8AVC2_BRACI|nr:hypothetical protein Bca52824_024075 [Brassica carinata]